MRLPALLLVFLFAVAGCATLPGPGASAPVRGLVRPATDDGALTLDDSGVIRTLAGPSRLLDQLARIPGAIVAIQGTATPRVVRVRDFEIIDAGDGLRPLVGWLIVDQAGVQLEDSVTGTRLALRGRALAELKEQHGARVWVTGSVNGPQTLLIAHWGILVPR
jgi:hypothetical protein